MLCSVISVVQAFKNLAKSILKHRFRLLYKNIVHNILNLIVEKITEEINFLDKNNLRKLYIYLIRNITMHLIISFDLVFKFNGFRRTMGHNSPYFRHRLQNLA